MPLNFDNDNENFESTKKGLKDNIEQNPKAILFYNIYTELINISHVIINKEGTGVKSEVIKTSRGRKAVLKNISYKVVRRAHNRTRNPESFPTYRAVLATLTLQNNPRVQRQHLRRLSKPAQPRPFIVSHTIPQII